ncbi:polysaccharide deacetylase family protein [Anoxybacteroides rupiense]|uniref:Polysaccharide deacetylase family protein n=1 Tax=Anoxybacteroides rupiense TaxID=311460 RepID=A0ABD5IUT6_9BACL|nr:polysaccharide deacetylase family protein [Anoxybacillus rupiensis]MBB3908561.1 peptidoglycan/xylan/chitin deacetylase (PgdA/CDA1 family) [Anoxybacillus rupiensis]MED5051752.1 polysaccharide deacetylase family protein [Anoxybacillus rupiensis]
MKRISYIVAAICMALLAIVVAAARWIPQHFEKKIEATDDRTFFCRKVHGRLEPAGKLYKNQPFYAIQYNKNWYVTEIGGKPYYIYQQRVKELNRSFTLSPLASPKAIQTVRPKENIWVYQAPRFGQPIGVLYKNTPVQVTATHGDWYQIMFAGTTAYIHKKQVAGLATAVPIIVYHHILKEKENRKYHNPTVVSYEEFSKQMKLLHDDGYHTITLHDLEDFVKGKKDLPAKSIMIHFDDGLKTNYVYAYPVLKKYGLHAAAFLITSRNSRPLKPFNPDDYQFLNWKEIAKMGDVFEFASHTHALHNRGKDGIGNLVKVPAATVKADLLKSRQLLHGTTYFTYPFGQYKPETIGILKQTGFTLAFTTKIGTVKPGDDPYQLKRHGITPDMTLDEFKKVIQVVE